MTARPYRTLCISFYEDDLEKLDAKVAELKSCGYTKINRSMLLRVAVSCFEPPLLSVEIQELLERMHGRPAQRRQYQPRSKRQSHSCRECGESGHNALTCPTGDGSEPRTEPSALMEGV